MKKSKQAAWVALLFLIILCIISLFAMSLTEAETLQKAQTISRQIVNWCFFLMSFVCFGYYWLCGKKAGFHQSGLKLWLAVGALMLGRGVIVHFGMKIFGTAPFVPQVYFILHLICLFVFVCFLALEILIAVNAYSHCPEDTDVLIVLGAQSESPVLFARADAAADWMCAHPDVTAIASGGQGRNESISEAQSIAGRLSAKGIPVEKIVLESASRNTIENIRNSGKLIGDEKAVITLVSDDYHIFRAKCIAHAELNRRVNGLPVHSSRITLPHYMMREFFSALLWDMKQLRRKMTARN